MKFAVMTVLILAGLTASAQHEMMDMKPPPEMKKVEWMVGEWTTSFKMYPPGEGMEPMSSTGTSSTKMALGGRYLHTMATFSMGDMGSFEGMQMLSYDPDAKKWKATWFDSMSSAGMEMTGDLVGHTMTLISKPTPMHGMGDQTFRATATKVSDREMSFLLEMKDGDKWTKMIEGTYTKK
ncbi:MAG: DUF1579 family protein [Fimbriimonadales bacterium]